MSLARYACLTSEPTRVILHRNPSYAVLYFSVQATRKEQALNMFHRIQDFLRPFMKGMKMLGKDGVQVWKNRKIPKNQLTRRQRYLHRQTIRDAYIAAPLVLFFALPGIGYLGPLIGLRYPKYFLPHQFWTPSQALRFFEEDTMLQRQKTQTLLQGYIAETGDIDALAWPSAVRSVFEERNINELPLHHAKELVVACRFLPKWMTWNESAVRKSLDLRSTEIIEDDQLLLSESVSGLSLMELQLACAERGIVADYGSEKHLHAALKKWLQLHQAGKRPSQLAVLHASACFPAKEQHT